MIAFFFFYERYFNCKKYKKYKKKTKEVQVSSNVVAISSNLVEVNKAVHIIFFKYYKRLKR